MRSFQSSAGGATTGGGESLFRAPDLPSAPPFSAACLVDISSTATITLSFYLTVVEPTLRRRLRRRRGRFIARKAPSVFVRGVLFSPVEPKLQHAEWAPTWGDYLATRRRCGLTATGASLASARAVWGEARPLLGGKLKPPIRLRLADSSPHPSHPLSCEEGGPSDVYAECFRVDSFIPMKLQVQQAVRHLLRYRRPKGNTADGGEVPNSVVLRGSGSSTTVEPLNLIHLIAVVCPDHFSDDYVDFFMKLHQVTRRGGGENIDIWGLGSTPAANQSDCPFEGHRATMSEEVERGEEVECLVFNSRELVGCVYV
ncbi:unnamed protein product [Phytomonas sp. EM1]|nr:unnamed protein product [Phytomonas sp. EM1]|eukprot:CCW62980.1 unnamed protein product [Phytomonas sp. isolate EM1]